MIHNIPWTAPVEPAPHGLLQSPDWWIPLAYGLVALLALCCVPGQARESAKALWAPAAAFLRRLYVPWLWEGLFIAGSVLCVLRPVRWDNWPDDNEWPDEDEGKYPADDGFVAPCLT